MESLIALSIAYVAADNLFGRDVSHRWAIAFGFGLVHGLGFNGAISNLDLVGSGAVTLLLGFNLGVEVGQMAILAAFAPLLYWSARRNWFPPAQRTASAACLAVAGFLFFARALLQG